jgi:hypothetical protein
MECEKPKKVEVEKYDETYYDEMLDESGTVLVGGLEFWPSRILSELDPIAYRCGMSDIQEYETKYKCPECEGLHDDEDEARECCQDSHQCDECETYYDDDDEAINCCKDEEDED